MFDVVLLWVIKPLLLLLFGGLQFRALKRSSATARHLHLALLVGMLPVLVLVGLLWPAPLPLPVLPELNALPHGWLMGLMALYATVATWLLFYGWLGMLQLWFIRRAAVNKAPKALQEVQDELLALVGLPRPVFLIVADEECAPASWGWFHPVIMLPASAVEWSRTQIRFVLLHELGHIARYDWPLLLMAKHIAALFWFLPPVWWLQQKLQYMSEQASDDWVLNLHGRPDEYVQLLLDLERGLKSSDLPVTPLLPKSNFARFQAALEASADHDVGHGHEWRGSVTVGACLLLLLSQIGLSPKAESYASSIEPRFVLEELPNKVDASERFMASLLASIRVADAEQALRPIFSVAPAVPQREDTGWMPPATSSARLVSPVLPVLPEKGLTPSVVQVKGYLPVRMVTPIYPRRALKRGIEGRVMVQFDIDEQGLPQKPRIVYAQPKGVFDNAVKAALMQSRFQPSSVNGGQVYLRGVSEEFIFRLTDEAIEPDANSPPRSTIPSAVTEIVFKH